MCVANSETPAAHEWSEDACYFGDHAVARSDTRVAGEDVLLGLGELRALTATQTQSWQQRWRETFARPLKKATGQWTHRGFDWHVFSYEYVFSLTGDEARNAYRATRERSLVVVPNLDDSGVGCVIRFEEPPNLEGRVDDLYLFPESLEWTMVFTHEDGWCGPYFSRKAWVANPPTPPPKAHASRKRKVRGNR